MADENILAGMTAEQADADIAARETKVEQLEATLRVAKDNLKAARSERKHLAKVTADVERVFAEFGDGNGTAAEAGAAEGTGEARS